IHSFSVLSSSSSASVIGIYSDSATTAGFTEFRNNMIRLGINPDSTSVTAKSAVYGISKSGNGNINALHNTIYIGGAGVASGSASSACLRRASTGTDNIYNNIFVNERTNSGTGGNHYTLMLNSNASLGCDGN